MKFARSLAQAATILGPTTGVAVAQRVDEGSVRFAQLAALDGPAAALGTGKQRGIVAAFGKANRKPAPCSNPRIY